MIEKTDYIKDNGEAVVNKINNQYTSNKYATCIDEPLFTFKEWSITVLVGMVLLVIGCFIIAAQHGQIQRLRQERDKYAEIISTANTELLTNNNSTTTVVESVAVKQK